MRRWVAFVLALSLCGLAASCGLPSNGTGSEETNGVPDAGQGLDSSMSSMDVQAGEASMFSTSNDAAAGDASSPGDGSAADDGSLPDDGNPPDEAGSPDDAATMDADASEVIPDASADVVDAMQMPETSAPEGGACACNAGCSPVTDCSACPATPYLCGGTCQKDCTKCAGATLQCAAKKTCMASCAACTGNPIECFTCPSFGVASATDVPVGTCNPATGGAASYCLGGFGTYPPGWHHCECATAADCPGETQVCSMNVGCQTCGEAPSAQQTGSTAGEACKGGGTCHGTQCN